jgi:hypothetical protein
VPAPYEAFQLPEGASIDDAQSRELTELELPHLQALQYEIVQLGLALDAGIVERVADFAPEVFDKLRQLDRLRAEARRLDQAILSLTGHRFETVRDHSPIFEFPSPLVGRIRAKLHQLAEDVAAETGGRARA